MSAPTMSDNVRECLRRNGPQSVDELAALLGLTPDQARHALRRERAKGSVQLVEAPRFLGYGGGGLRGRYAIVQGAEPLRFQPLSRPVCSVWDFGAAA